ncbi:MAG: TolC family protein [bacterium]
MNNYCRILCGVLFACGLANPAAAQQMLTPATALELAATSHPSLAIVAAQKRRAELLVEQEEYRYIPVFNASGGFQYGRSPQLSAAGTTFVESNSLVLTSGISHTLPVGTQIAATLELGRSFRDSVFLGALGTAYDTTLKLEVSQPLLRGAGKDVGEAQLRAARYGLTAAEAEAKSQTSALALEVLNAYWSLWSAQRSVEIEGEALEVSKKQLADAEFRLSVGAVAPAQLVPMRIEIARAEESLVSAKSVVRQRAITLAQLVGLPPGAELIASPDGPSLSNTTGLEQALELARSNSPRLARLRVALESSKISVAQAEDAALPRLDATGSVQVAGLGTTVGDSFSEFAGFDAIVLFAGLRLELPVINRAREIDVERSQVSVTIAQAEYDQTERELNSRVAGLLNDLGSSDERLRLARETAALTRENVTAQSARFDAGKATTLDVIDSLKSFREAEFRVTQLQVERALTQLQLEEATGVLAGM